MARLPHFPNGRKPEMFLTLATMGLAVALVTGTAAQAQKPLKIDTALCESRAVKLSFHRGGECPWYGCSSDANACLWRPWRYTANDDRLELGGALHSCHIRREGSDYVARFRVPRPQGAIYGWGVVVRDGYSTKWLLCEGEE